ncbi:MAG: UbiA family prenyltransferase [Nitrospinae bacterium]|nr:UbiA family prenyltransferase [Nitrospinota bacterium]
MIKPLAAILGDIKIQHTLFAMPFAIMSAFMAADGVPPLALLGWITAAMVLARSAAMAFNRLVDEPFDSENPRTQNRALPAGEASRVQYMIFILACGVGFIMVCSMINVMAARLAPFALLIVFFYSYTKRITHYSHFFLGLALSLAPMGGWVAVREEFALAPSLLGIAVIFWLAGLDTIYSCQDARFDSEKGLYSIPRRFGVGKALSMASAFHAVMVAALLLVAVAAHLSWIYLAGVGFTALMLYYEHSLVRPEDLSKVNVAFFNVNGVISVGLMVFTIADIIIKP